MAGVVAAFTIVAGVGVLALSWAFHGYYNDDEAQEALQKSIEELQKEKIETDTMIKMETDKEKLAVLKEKTTKLTTDILEKTVELQQLQIKAQARDFKLYQRIDILT